MSKAQATPLWKRISRDTALDMVAGKVKVVKEKVNSVDNLPQSGSVVCQLGEHS